MSEDQKTIIFLDTETTGLLKPDICELGAQPYITEIYCVKLDEKFNMIGEFQSFFHVPFPLDDFISRLTGITDEMLEDQPEFVEKYDSLAEFFKGSDIAVGHNVNFDMDMIKIELRRIGFDYYFPWPKERHCTVELSFPIENKRLKLSVLYKMATENLHEGSHRAKADTLATVKCYQWLRKQGLI
jgi:DNA polymerase III epsilon subunit-like protein|tara:strand:- start:4240 stop:4794 length:555 start_codon:yes stop_codon:yes gene_type:complete